LVLDFYEASPAPLGPLNENSPLFEPSSNFCFKAYELLHDEFNERGFCLNLGRCFASISIPYDCFSSIFCILTGDGDFSESSSSFVCFFSDDFCNTLSFFSGVPTDIFSAESFFIYLKSLFLSDELFTELNIDLQLIGVEVADDIKSGLSKFSTFASFLQIMFIKSCLLSTFCFRIIIN
jgi:hypothetical protein